MITLATLLDVQTPVEDAIKALFEKPPKLIDVFTSRETGDLTKTRLDVTFTIGAWADRWLPDAAGTLQHSAWQYSLTLGLYTSRQEKSRRTHGELRGEIRARITAAVRRPVWLRHHTLASLNETTGTESIRFGDDLDVSAMSFGGLVTIRSDSMRLVG